MFNKLSVKIGILIFVFILIIEMFLCGILYTNLVNERIDEVLNRLLARGNSHRDVLEENFGQTTLAHIGLMESVSEFIVVVTDEKGDIIVSSDLITPEMKQVMEHTGGIEIPSEGKVVEDQWKKKEYIATDSPITIDSKHKGHVFMFAETTQVKKVVDQLSDHFIIFGFIAIVLTIITIFILSRFITLPLIKMKEATKLLSKGRHKVELHTDRKDELGELANAIISLSNELERMKTERNEFLASISHELRTPLTYIKGYADIINRSETSESEMKEYTSIIREETEQLTLLIKNLFDLAKMDQNSFLIKREEVMLYDLVRSVSDRITPVFAEKSIVFSVSCPRNIVAFIDPERFQQVLINILDNAKNHSHEGDQVSLEVSQTNQDVKIVISDQGEGVPKEDLPYLFERLYRVEKSRSRQSGGNGLGLAIVKEIVEYHGGTIEAVSERGKGMSIIIKLARGGYLG